MVIVDVSGGGVGTPLGDVVTVKAAVCFFSGDGLKGFRPLVGSQFLPVVSFVYCLDPFLPQILGKDVGHNHNLVKEYPCRTLGHAEPYIAGGNRPLKGEDGNLHGVAFVNRQLAPSYPFPVFPVVRYVNGNAVGGSDSRHISGKVAYPEFIKP